MSADHRESGKQRPLPSTQSNREPKIDAVEPLGRSEGSALPYGTSVLPQSLRAPSVPEGSRLHKG